MSSFKESHLDSLISFSSPKGLVPRSTAPRPLVGSLLARLVASSITAPRLPVLRCEAGTGGPDSLRRCVTAPNDRLARAASSGDWSPSLNGDCVGAGLSSIIVILDCLSRFATLLRELGFGDGDDRLSNAERRGLGSPAIEIRGNVEGPRDDVFVGLFGFVSSSGFAVPTDLAVSAVLLRINVDPMENAGLGGGAISANEPRVIPRPFGACLS